MFKGSFVALITPFKDGEIDEKKVQELVEWQITQKTDGIVPVGTTGESATLSHAEHAHVIEIVAKAVRKRVPGDVAIMTDFNQALDVAEAIRRGRALDDEGVYWIEEPIRHDDFAGCAEIARAVATPVQIGENFSQVHDMEKALAARSCDLVMPDLERIGGITGWLITKGSPKEAVDFLKYFVSKDVQTRLAAGNFIIPVVQGADAGLNNSFMKLIAANLAKSNYHQNFYDQSLGPSVGRVVNDVTAEIAGGSMSPQDAAKAIEAAWKQGN